MRIFILAKNVIDNGIIVKQKIKAITDKENIYDDINLTVYELPLSNYDIKKVTGFNYISTLKSYIACCATHSVNAPFVFYKSYITDLKCVYHAWGINRIFMDTGFTFKYRGLSFFLYNHFDTNVAAGCKHYIERIKEEQ